MIGIVGPEDSVALATEVARELGRSSELVGLSYRDADDAVRLARQLEPTCEVLLFTGRVPFEQAKRSGEWRCDLDVILHSQADLYRMIGLMLKARGGEFPRVSIDSIGATTVSRLFSDIGLPPPFVVTLPPNEERPLSVLEVGQLTARAHLAAIESGQVDSVMTCIAGTYRTLTETGVDVWRIDHATVTITQALERAWLSSQLRQNKGRSPAIVLIKAAGVADEDPSAPSAMLQQVNAHARRLGSRVTVDKGRYLLATTRAAIKDMLERHRKGQKSLVDVMKQDAQQPVAIGIGLGGTYDTALDSAESGLQISELSGAAMMVREDGSIEAIGTAAHIVGASLQETSSGVLALSEETGLGPLTLHRLVSALNRVDHTAVTAQQLAEFYGVTPRSARRMLSMLLVANYARESGVRGAAGAGRPHVVYEVDLPTLSKIMSSASESPS